MAVGVRRCARAVCLGIAPLLASILLSVAGVGAGTPVQSPTWFLFSRGPATPVMISDVELLGATGQSPGDYLSLTAKWTGAFVVQGVFGSLFSNPACTNAHEKWTVINLWFDVVVEGRSTSVQGAAPVQAVASMRFHQRYDSYGGIEMSAESTDEGVTGAYRHTISGSATLDQLLAFKEIRDARIMQLQEEDQGKQFRVRVRVKGMVAVTSIAGNPAECPGCASGESPVCSEWSGWGYSGWETIAFSPQPFTLKFFFDPIRYEGDARSDLDVIKEVAGTWENLAGLSEDEVLQKVYVDLLDDYFEMRELSQDRSLGAELPCHATTAYWGESIHVAKANTDITLTYVIECQGVKYDTDYAWALYHRENGDLYRDSLLIHIDSAGDFLEGEWLEEHHRVASAEATVPVGMVRVRAGAFQMGDSFGEGNANEHPVHTVYVSAFYIDRYEVTKTLWDEVANWATAHGYDIGPLDGHYLGRTKSDPVIFVSWYEAAKWANARSEKEGLAPCYFEDAAQRSVYRTGEADLVDEWVKWNASGYRLPTEAEWEKAARGGVEGRRFSWDDTDTIDHDRANYFSSGQLNYDTSSTRGNHPASADGVTPVGMFAPNGYGLYDVTGNVWEWCWDLFQGDYYATSPGRNPHGGNNDLGTRVYRGGYNGGWGFASSCRVANRDGFVPSGEGLDLGFRLVRTAQ